MPRSCATTSTSCAPLTRRASARFSSSFWARWGRAPASPPPFWCDYGYNIELGEYFFSNHNLVILDGAKVTFGDNVFVAPNCGFYTAGHPVDAALRRQGIEYARPIRVGYDVWIGAGVHVMPGVTIGDNVVIGGGSVVVSDIPSNCVTVGNPCRPIRYLEVGEKVSSACDYGA